MTEKVTMRKEFAGELVEANMDQETMEKYLQSDMTQSPLEFNKEHGPDKEMEEFLNDEFPREKK